MPARSGRLDALAAAIERASSERDVLLKRDAIPYGVKFTLSQGAAVGVIAVYTSGKVVPNPKAEEYFADVLAAIAPLAAARAPGATGASAKARASTAVGAHDAVEYPYVGSDESGKGDYFGPLVVAAVLVDDAREDKLLQEIGVRDSKLLTGTRPARAIAAQVREVCAGRFAEVVILPARYNRRVADLKKEGKSSNALLAGAHVEAYEPLLARGAALAVADKFGSEHYIKGELKKKGLAVKLRQETKGERYTAVAAGSILARDRCLEWFEQAEAEVGERLPRGAFDPGIIHVARRLHAKGLLGGYAKLHFRTTLQVTGGLGDVGEFGGDDGEPD